ncbi:hypothetical protein Ae201684_008888 [Aphanomyces euteiches]|uniref:Uncharacterized protein n=1 Tax=Aphanomyces euteiches TaxID=100861 RepID=A0A6G0X3K2_9STRA|nr:hypothetical protein Ae201684_008888 [Aphanomyces euteiches]
MEPFGWTTAATRIQLAAVKFVGRKRLESLHVETPKRLVACRETSTQRAERADLSKSAFWLTVVLNASRRLCEDFPVRCSMLRPLPSSGAFTCWQTTQCAAY